MAYDERLAERTREVLARKRDVREQKMFGGLCFLLRGNMCCGIAGDELIVRVGPDAYDTSLARPHARPMDFTGRPLRGLVYVAAPGLRTRRSLAQWVDRGVAFASSLPPK